ncbi:MAG: polyisoprenoid-binding protein [Alphaproteobacteria bacterium]|nr:MAG: polyisoprenoid-binding protein [Alphaproteobacteria bacterium]
MLIQSSGKRKGRKPVRRRFSRGSMPAMALALLLILNLAACAKVSTGLKVLTHRPSGDPTAIHAGRYESDPDHRFLILEVDHLGFSRVPARFENWCAILDIDPQSPERTLVQAEIATASLTTGVPAIDARIHRLLNSERYPTIRFVSQKVERTGPAEARLFGTVTMAGRSAPVAMRVVFNGGGRNPLTGRYTLGFSAIGRLDRSRWGLGKWRPAVGDRVDFRVEAEFVMSPSSDHATVGKGAGSRNRGEQERR